MYVHPCRLEENTKRFMYHEMYKGRIGSFWEVGKRELRNEVFPLLSRNINERFMRSSSPLPVNGNYLPSICNKTARSVLGDGYRHFFDDESFSDQFTAWTEDERLDMFMTSTVAKTMATGYCGYRFWVYEDELKMDWCNFDVYYKDRSAHYFVEKFKESNKDFRYQIKYSIVEGDWQAQHNVYEEKPNGKDIDRPDVLLSKYGIDREIEDRRYRTRPFYIMETGILSDDMMSQSMFCGQETVLRAILMTESFLAIDTQIHGLSKMQIPRGSIQVNPETGQQTDYSKGTYIEMKEGMTFEPKYVTKPDRSEEHIRTAEYFKKMLATNVNILPSMIGVQTDTSGQTATSTRLAQRNYNALVGQYQAKAQAAFDNIVQFFGEFYGLEVPEYRLMFTDPNEEDIDTKRLLLEEQKCGLLAPVDYHAMTKAGMEESAVIEMVENAEEYDKKKRAAARLPETASTDDLINSL